MLHVFIDSGRADIERAAEDEGEAEDVVDLVREVGAAGADHRIGACRTRIVRHDLRHGIGERHHQRLVAHLLDHFGLQHVWCRQADEDVRARNHIGHHPRIGLLRIDRLPAVHRGVAPLVHDAVDVADPDVLALRAHRYQEIQRRDRRSTRAGADDLDVGQLLAVELQGVDDRGRHDDGGTVLVVVKHRDFHPFLQLRLDLETFRPADVLEIDAAEGRLKCCHRLNHPLDRVGGDFDVEHIDAGELLEQDRLALHHGLGGERADIAEAEHRGAVGDDSDEVGARGQGSGFRRILRDLGAGSGDAGRIGQRQVALVGERLGRLDFKFSRPRQPVIGQRRGVELFRIRRHARFPRGLPPPPKSDIGGLFQFCGRLSRM